MPGELRSKKSYLLNKILIDFFDLCSRLLDEPLSPKPSVGECGEDYFKFYLHLHFRSFSRKNSPVYKG